MHSVFIYICAGLLVYFFLNVFILKKYVDKSAINKTVDEKNHNALETFRNYRYAFSADLAEAAFALIAGRYFLVHLFKEQRRKL